MSTLTSKVVSEGLEAWALMGLGNTPREIPARMGAVWLLSLESIGTTLEEWQWVRGYVATERGRRYWPSTPEICDLIRDRRSRREAEKEWFTIDGQLRRLHPDEYKALPGGGS